ncbi:lymphocyte cytosolic protein 2a isoform X1 [Gymnodraco acuticeps]|uniref:Lymphocyte cytosolic protein 2a isoform X1 n=1 Tax=Gymnodraco acuticeps TaxID=8218 RepID=A0A6P8VFG7_GYMAC|nr:lymphocyte cytosolic protein 2a isoform X1 [Gymnodraco acuticeps]
MITKISSQISKKEEKRSLFGIKPTRYHEPAEAAAEVQGWGADEFSEEELDDDYEDPDSGGDGGGSDYESPMDDDNNDYEPPPSEPPEDMALKLGPPRPLGDGVYIGHPPAVCPRPPAPSLSVPSGEHSSRRDPSPRGGGRKFPPGPPPILRVNKPGRDSGPNPSPIRGPHRNTVEKPGANSWRPQPDDPPVWNKPATLPPTPTPTSVSRSDSSARPAATRFEARREQTYNEAPKNNTFPLQNKSQPPRPGRPSRQGDSLPPSLPSAGSLPHKLQPGFGGSDRQSFRPTPPTAAPVQDLDPSWYVGRVTRGQAEGSLQQVNKDGAFLVRDSTRQLAQQPFTLMVLFQQKVFNIQIREQAGNFLLGTGLKVKESFPSVSNIVSHYSQSPLLLIDAKNRGSGQQNQCLLSEPAGPHMGQNQWS